MKVFFTVDTLLNAGTEKSLLEIITHFSNDVDVTVIYFYPKHNLKPLYDAAGIRLIFMDLPGATSFRKGIKQLSELIRREKPDLVVSSILRANIISRFACRKTGTKLVGTFVSDSYSEQRKTSFSLKRKTGAYFYYWLDRITAKIPVCWIANSESTKKSNCHYLEVDPSKVKVVYRGRDINQFQEKVNSRTNVFRFVFVGRLIETKGVNELVQAFQQVHQKYPNVSLDIFGDGTYKSHLAQLINGYDLSEKITLHGNVLNGWQKLYDADCFVFPSWYEGFSGSLVEAMMVGIPIIASDIPMNLEAVEHMKSALIFKRKDVDELFQSMSYCIEHYDECCKMAANARKIASDRFDIRIISSQYEHILKSVAETRVVKTNV